MSELKGAKGRGRPKRRWKDGVKKILGYWDLSIQEGERHALDRRSDVVCGGQCVVDELNWDIWSNQGKPRNSLWGLGCKW